MSKKRALAVAFTSLLIALMLISQAKAVTSSLYIPQFTAKYLDTSYSTEEISSTDPQTGKTFIIPSIYFEHKSIKINIIDQNPAGSVYYNIQYKSHFEVEWHSPEIYYHVPIDLNATLRCTSNEVTPTGDVYVTLGRQIDLRVQAFSETEESDWSNIQTIIIANGAISTTIPSNTSSPSPSPSISQNPSSSPTLSPTIEPTTEPTSTPKQPSGFLGTNLPVEYGYAIITVLVMAVVAGLSLICLKKLRK